MKKILIFAFFSWQIGIPLAGQNLSQANASAKKATALHARRKRNAVTEPVQAVNVRIRARERIIPDFAGPAPLASTAMHPLFVR